MKYITLLVLSTISLIGFTQTANECKRYRTGKFEIDNLDGTISTIIRTKRSQQEISPFFSSVDKVKWISECSFQLIPQKGNDKAGILGSQVLTITIVEVGEHHYVMKVTGLGEGVEIYGKVYEKGYLNYDER